MDDGVKSRGDVGTEQDDGEDSVVARGMLRQIGEVAAAVGLSLRTVRFYEEAGLVVPVRRSRGGFRLYDDDSIERFRLIMQMKPLGFTVEEMGVLIKLRAELADPHIGSERHGDLLERLNLFVEAATDKVQNLREQLQVAEAFASQLIREAETAGDA